MSTRNLDALFRPRVVSLIGASNHPNSVGAVLARNLQAGGFRGPILTVNPHEISIGSTLNYHSVADLPLAPDLAVLATPPDTIPALIAELGGRGCRAAVVITAGFGEGGRAAGDALRQKMLEAARPHLLRIVGPNCLGFMSPGAGLNASFAHLAPNAGAIAFLSQSGALVTAVLDWAAHRSVGFSHIASLGDMSDVDFGDLLDYLSEDAATGAILLYVESLKAARKFMSAGRIAARAKPVIVMKAGRSQSGAKAAMSHTGALAGADAVYDAAFRRAGMLRVFELQEIFEAAETLSKGLSVRGDRLTIVTNGGGAGVLAADALEAAGGRLASLSPAVKARLDAVLPTAWSGANPIDIIGDASGERYAAALEAVMRQPDQDALLVMNCPTGIVGPTEASDALLRCLGAWTGPPVLTCWLGESTAQKARRAFDASGAVTYDTPDAAIRAFMHLVDYQKNQSLLMETPIAGVSAGVEAKARARSIVERALTEGRNLLSEVESKAVISAYGVPVAESRIARDAEEAAAVAAEIGFPCALKIHSPDISHKSDVGGVRLDLRSAAEVAEAAASILEQVRLRAPEATLAGLTVEPMINRPGAHELIAGVIDDGVFGPVVLFGQGGISVEVQADRALGLPPLNSVLAREMIDRTRVARLLRGYRDVAAVDFSAIEDVLVRIADLAIDLPELVELDINPLMANSAGVIALDARMVIRAPGDRGRDRLAIRPYPSEFEREVALASGVKVRLRAVRPEDAPLVSTFLNASGLGEPGDEVSALVRSEARAKRLSQIDYDRELTILAVREQDVVLGMVRLLCNPDITAGVYAVLTLPDADGAALGPLLAREIITAAAQRGLASVGESPWPALAASSV